MADREEKVDIVRTPAGLTVKATLKQDGCTVSYSVKPYGTNIELAVREARGAAGVLLSQALRAAP